MKTLIIHLRNQNIGCLARQILFPSAKTAKYAGIGIQSKQPYIAYKSGFSAILLT
jgi:hypothetical protein